MVMHDLKSFTCSGIPGSRECARMQPAIWSYAGLGDGFGISCDGSISNMSCCLSATFLKDGKPPSILGTLLRRNRTESC